MDSHRYTSIKLITLLCLLSSAPSAPPPPSAADALRARGYSLFASLVASISTSANFSGTLLAPPDFAFSSAAAKFLAPRRPPPRPSVSLLLFHTLAPPLVLTWPALSSSRDGLHLRTHYDNTCLHLLRSPYGGEISISPSPYANRISSVKIRQPDVYVDEHLTVHGIDGVLDPSFAVKCDLPFPDPMADNAPVQVNRSFLDRAMRALRRTGYNVVASGMAIRISDLLSLTSVTVFAVSDENLFLRPNGFRYNFRRHVVPMRHRFDDLAKFTALDTLAPNRSLAVSSFNGAVSVDGVAVDETEVYRNRWIVVVSVMTSLDDSRIDSPIAEVVTDDSPTPAPATDDVSDAHCDLSDVVSIGVEGGDLLCPAGSARRLREMDDDVEESRPSDGYSQVTDELTRFDKGQNR